jgi:hypothetical protein
MSEDVKYDEVLFRVLLQREEQRPRLTIPLLEAVVPRQQRKQVVDDYLRFIREEELEFDFAFQKSIRKHFPGVYYVIVAAEFLYHIPFHEALGFFLGTASSVTPKQIDQEKIYELAEELARQVRERARQLAVEDGKRRAVRGPKQAPRTTRCGFCKRVLPFSEITRHVEENHLGPPGPGAMRVARPTEQLPRPVAATALSGPGPNQPTGFQPVIVSPPPWMDHFRTGRCIGCQRIPIPGDFYCYYCVPTK